MFVTTLSLDFFTRLDLALVNKVSANLATLTCNFIHVLSEEIKVVLLWKEVRKSSQVKFNTEFRNLENVCSEGQQILF